MAGPTTYIVGNKENRRPLPSKPSPSIHSGSPAHGMVPPTFKVDLPTSVKLSLWKHPYRHTQNCVSKGALSLNKLMGKADHRRAMQRAVSPEPISTSSQLFKNREKGGNATKWWSATMVSSHKSGCVTGPYSCSGRTGGPQSCGRS